MFKRFFIGFYIFCVHLSLYSESVFSQEAIDSAQTSNVLIAISAYYVPERLQYLENVLLSLSTLPKTHVIILTNTFKEKELKEIQNICDKVLLQKTTQMSTSIRSYDVSGPYGFFLTWKHKPIISNEFIGKDYTHFIYLEDDIYFDFSNFCYFIEYRKLFQDIGLLPSFLRVEYHNNFRDFINTDNLAQVEIEKQPHVETDDYWFVNLPNPYMACFILDQELATEYIQTRSFDLDQSWTVMQWDVRERAAMGLCFEQVPPRFHSRYVVAVSKKTCAAPKCAWIHHLPNNYANGETGNVRILMNKLFIRPH
jgi:hypothetical protein